MTATTLAPTGARTATGVTFPRILASETIKFRTVRSTFWALPITAAVMAAFAALQGWGATQMDMTAEDLGAGVASLAVSGVIFAQVVVAVLAILSIGGEYSTGQIRSTLTAVPTRVPALLGKAVVVAAGVFVAGLVSVALSLAASLPFLSQLGLSLEWSGDTVRVVVGAALYLATIALFAFAIGALMRHTAGAIAVVLGLLLVVENVVAALPFRFFEVIAPYLPQSAGSRILMDDAALAAMAEFSGTSLGPWQGYAVLAAWALVLLAAAAVLLRRRDA